MRPVLQVALMVALSSCDLDDRRPRVVVSSPGDDAGVGGMGGTDSASGGNGGTDSSMSGAGGTPSAGGDAGSSGGDAGGSGGDAGAPGEPCVDGVLCGDVCRPAGSCCLDAECGGPAVGTCDDSGQCACQPGSFGARCTGRLLGLGVARPQQDSDAAAMAL